MIEEKISFFAHDPAGPRKSHPLVAFIKRKIMKPLYYGFMRMLPERLAIAVDYTVHMHRLPRLARPRTFNEKIQWRKLYERDPRFTDLVDKAKAKQIVAKKFGNDFVIPTLFETSDPDTIPFDRLKPPYIIKATHSSHMNIIVLDHVGDAEAIRRHAREWLAYDHSLFAREWAYAGVPRKIIIEPLIGGRDERLNDYRFHVFNGRVFCIEVDVADPAGYRTNLYTPQWEKLPVEYGPFPNSAKPVERPEKLSEMLERASLLGRGISYVRVDLYNVDGKPLFGELTLYPCAGCGRFRPERWDLLMGEQWQLPHAEIQAARSAKIAPRGATST